MSRGARGVTLHSAAWARLIKADVSLLGNDWRDWDGLEASRRHNIDDDVLRIASVLRYIQWDWKANKHMLTEEGRQRVQHPTASWEKSGRHWIFLANCFSGDGLEEFVSKFEEKRGVGPRVAQFDITDADLRFLVESLPKSLLKKPAHAELGTW